MNKTKFNMRLLKTGISSNSEPILIFANNDSHGETFFPSCLSLITARESEIERERERERERVREQARYVGKEREKEWKRQLKRQKLKLWAAGQRRQRRRRRRRRRQRRQRQWRHLPGDYSFESSSSQIETKLEASKINIDAEPAKNRSGFPD